MTANDKIKAKVKHLLAIAMDEGATPAEANAAMTKAHKIMAAQGLTEADMMHAEGDAFSEGTWDAKTRPGKSAVFHPVDSLMCSTIGKFCGCKHYFARGQRGDTEVGRSVFFGLSNDVDMASWLRELLIEQFDEQWRVYRDITRTNKSTAVLKGARQSFSMGFAAAVVKRLEDWLHRSESFQKGTDNDNALVLVKQDLVTAELERRGIMLRPGTGRAKPITFDAQAAGAGRNAGDAARLSAGVERTRQLLLG